MQGINDFDLQSQSSLNTDFKGGNKSNFERVQSNMSEGMAGEVLKMLSEMNKKIETISDSSAIA